MVQRTGVYPSVRVDGAGRGVVSSAGGVLLTETVRVSGLGRVLDDSPATPARLCCTWPPITPGHRSPSRRSPHCAPCPHLDSRGHRPPPRRPRETPLRTWTGRPPRATTGHPATATPSPTGKTQHQQRWEVSPRSHPAKARKIWA